MTVTDKYEYESLITHAFNKLSSYIYFDKQNLLIREKLAEFIEAGKNNSLKSIAGSIETYDGDIKKLLGEIRLQFLPKNVKENSIFIDANLLSKSFYTNQVYKDSPLIDRINVFIDAPFEIHLISVMWLLKYGQIFDEALGSHCVGNRLDYNPRKLSGRLLFKKYEQEYQSWWSKGINEAKKLFDDGNNVTILSFDFKDYYHSIEIDLNELDSEIQRSKAGIQHDNLHKIFKDIHKVYFEKLAEIKHPAIRKMGGSVSLPIGLLSSSVLANWYLKDFDESVLDNIQPAYYGRYVDDLMIVINDTLISEFTQHNIDKIKQSISLSDDKQYIIYYYLTTYFSAIFKLSSGNPSTYSVTADKYSNLFLQGEKFSIFQFNVDFSPQLLNRFIESQQEKSSAFQFLSEDDDNIFKDLEKISFENNFQSHDISTAEGLKDIDENKFKLSIYLSKLARGSVIGGNEYNQEEALKVKKYFKGYYLLKNYFFWEKLLSIWIVRDDVDFFFETIADIEEQIRNISFDLTREFVLDNEQLTAIGNKMKSDLRKYLKVSISMAAGLAPENLSSNVNEKSSLSNDNIYLYRRTCLLRKNLIFYPLIQFCQGVSAGNFSLCNKSIIENALNNLTQPLALDAPFYPYRVKLNECSQFIFLQNLQKASEMAKSNSMNTRADFINCKDFLDGSFQDFCKINAIPEDEKEEVRKAYYHFDTISKRAGKIEFGPDVIVRPLKVPDNLPKESLRVCLVNKYVDFNESALSMTGSPLTDIKRFEDFNRILDDVKKVKNPDIFVMPEICLPYQFIPHTILYSVHNQTGCITGVEHWPIGNMAFNFVLTVLPLRIFEDSDAIVVPRLKNHYAPEEEREIEKIKMKVPNPVPYNYELFFWRGTYFSVYYCFELANVRHRNLLLGLVDVIFAPIWNRDIHYYNSMIESATRDMHCFIVLANTTQYGDSRITRPADHVRRDKLRIKGGTAPDHKAIVVVADLEIKQLREFQVSPPLAEPDALKKNKFKPLPPNFPIGAAEMRKDLSLFSSDNFFFFLEEEDAIIYND